MGSGGLFRFSCSWKLVSVGFLWVDRGSGIGLVGVCGGIIFLLVCRLRLSVGFLR